jgi:hypothetical protein
MIELRIVLVALFIVISSALSIIWIEHKRQKFEEYCDSKNGVVLRSDNARYCINKDAIIK